MPDRYGNPTNEEIKAMQARTIANRRAQHAAQVAAAAPAKARGRRDLQELEASRRRAEIERNKQLAIRESEKRNLDRRRAEARAAQPGWDAPTPVQPPPIQPPPLQPTPAQPAPVVAATTAAALQKPPADFGYDPDRPGVPREVLDDLEKQVRGEPQQAPGVSGFPGQAQAGTTTQQKPPMTAEDLGIQRDKALLAAKEAQQKLNNPNVPTPSNVQAEQELSKLPLSPPNYTPPTPEQRLEFEQRGTLGRQRGDRVPPEMEQNLDGSLNEAQRQAMRERLRSAMLETQQQKTLGGGIDRGAPSLEAAIDSGGKKWPGDPSDIQGIPVADATRDALRKPLGVSGFPGQDRVSPYGANAGFDAGRYAETQGRDWSPQRQHVSRQQAETALDTARRTNQWNHEMVLTLANAYSQGLINDQTLDTISSEGRASRPDHIRQWASRLGTADMGGYPETQGAQSVLRLLESMATGPQGQVYDANWNQENVLTLARALNDGIITNEAIRSKLDSKRAAHIEEWAARLASGGSDVQGTLRGMGW